MHCAPLNIFSWWKLLTLFLFLLSLDEPFGLRGYVLYLLIFVFKAPGGFEICTNNRESWLMKTSRSVHSRISYLSLLTDPIDVRELWIENCESHTTRGLLQTLRKRAWIEASSKSTLTFLLLALFVAKTPGLLSGSSPAAGGMAGQGRGNTVWQGKGGKEASCCPLS